jgi:hypothetical protein
MDKTLPAKTSNARPSARPYLSLSTLKDKELYVTHGRSIYGRPTAKEAKMTHHYRSGVRTSKQATSDRYIWLCTNRGRKKLSLFLLPQ